jgi:hypothetical protein
MTDSQLVKAYRQLNNGKKKLVFQLTIRGFASEINNMLSAILYCLENNIEFILFSKSWTARYDKGWGDYFLPFCKEYTNILFYRQSVFSIKGKERISNFVQKGILRNHYNAHDLWTKIRSSEIMEQEFDIPELGIKGDIYHAKRAILNMVLRFNNDIIKDRTAQSELLIQMKPYVSLHIRRGDKVTGNLKEADIVSLSKYVEQIEKIKPNISNVFIATDDYSVIEEFKKICPVDWQIITFCERNNKGYDEAGFLSKNSEETKTDMISLFNDLHFLAESEYFIGTYSSNIGRLIALIKGQDKCHSLDIKEWHPL